MKIPPSFFSQDPRLRGGPAMRDDTWRRRIRFALRSLATAKSNKKQNALAELIISCACNSDGEDGDGAAR